MNSTIEQMLEKRGILFANLSRCYTEITYFSRTIILNKKITVLLVIDKTKRSSDNTVFFGWVIDHRIT